MIIQKLGDIINEAKTSRKRGDITTLVVNIGNKRFFNTEASNTFVEVIELVSNEVGIEKFIKDYMENDISGRKFIGFKESDFPEYVRNIKTNSTGQFLINTHMSTVEKKNILDSLLEFYDIKGNIEVRNRVDSIPTDSKAPDERVYCVRGGRGNSDADLFIQGNFVGIGYDTIGFDIGSKTKEEINQFLLIKYKDSKTSVPQFLQQIELFKKIKEDDIILVPDDEGVNVGKVVSEIYLADDENYPNRLNIEWLEKVGKNKSVNQPKSVFEVRNFDTEEMDFTDVEMDYIDVDSEEFDNKGQYSDDELKEKLKELLSSNLGIIPKFTIFLKILLSENKKFTRDEIKKKLAEKLGSVEFSNPSRKFTSEGQAGVYLSHFSQFITKRPNDYLRQIIGYDTIRWSLEAETDVGAKKDNYQIVDRYRKLLSDVLNQSNDVVNIDNYVENPFAQSICILAESGVGKSTTTMKLLEYKYKHISEIIIPTATTTSLLAQYSPAGKKYILSRLGNLILDARNNPSKLYTAVIDECHKSSTIEMINDELLQCISKDRNLGKRFISVDDEISDLYLEPFNRERHRYPLNKIGNTDNLEIPKNFGFIFISSKPDIITSNSDFFNRVTVKILKKWDDKIDSFDNDEYFITIKTNDFENRKILKKEGLEKFYENKI
jgi:hypothetical protein